MAYRAMERRFRSDGFYRRDGLFHRPGTYAHLWPFSRALAATLDLAGVPPPKLVEGFDARQAVDERLTALEHYWNASATPPSYDSDVVEPHGTGGDRYYDDNAWIGLALVQHHRIGLGDRLTRAEQLFRFAEAGWDERGDIAYPGGVFWVEQGTGTGARNHDRNTVSTAPNAQLGLHLHELTGADHRETALRMCEWVESTLQGDEGLFYDKVMGDGSIDRTLWSYNQGTMIGLNVMLDRAGVAGRLERAEQIARRALAYYGRDGLMAQPPAFNAILFHNLLALNAATSDARLGDEVLAALRTYADELWERRDRRDLFRVSRRSATLLDQAAAVQVFALLAWDAADYGRLT